MARVIRAQRRGPRVVAGEVLDAHAQARRLREAATTEAARIREQAAREGRAQAAAELAAERLRAAAAEQARMQALEREALDVALMAAERIVGEAIAVEPARMASIVAQLLARVRRAVRVSVRVHPDDVAAIVGAHPELVAMLDAANPVVEVVADPTVRRGGCVLHSDVGSLDARLEVQLEALAKALEPR